MTEPYATPKSTAIETMTRRAWLVGGGSVAVLAALWWTQGPDARAGTFEIVKTDDEWRRLLKPEAYRVLRHEATERPYSSPLNGEKRKGTFACAGCDLPLFSSETKFESGTGWPSFYQAAGERGRDLDRPLAADGAHRGALPPLRRSSRPCVRGWAEADRAALLHERRRADVSAGGRPGPPDGARPDRLASAVLAR